MGNCKGKVSTRPPSTRTTPMMEMPVECSKTARTPPAESNELAVSHNLSTSPPQTNDEEEILIPQMSCDSFIQDYLEGEFERWDKNSFYRSNYSKAVLRESGEVVCVRLQSIYRFRKPIPDHLKQWQRVRSHPNIPRYISAVYDPDNEGYLVITEYFDSMTVDDLIRELGVLPEPVIAAICSETLKGLSYLHSLSLMHRRLQPRHIMINIKGEVKLTRPFKKDIIPTTQLHVDWWAPLDKYSRDPKIKTFTDDIWRLGVTVLQMAEGGSLPFFEENNPSIYVAANRYYSGRIVPRLDEEQGLWTSSIIDFVKKCCAVYPNRPTSTELLNNHPFITAASSSTQSASIEKVHDGIPTSGLSSTDGALYCRSGEVVNHRTKRSTARRTIPSRLQETMRYEYVRVLR